MRRRICIWFFVAMVLGACGRQEVIPHSVNHVSSPVVSPSLVLSTQKQYALDMVNYMRATRRICGRKVYEAAKPLRWSEPLYQAAYEHSQDMAYTRYFSHKGSGQQSDRTCIEQGLGCGSNFVERSKQNGYIAHRGLAENIAYGAKSIDEVMQQWMASSGHCKNIMNPKFTEFGMAEVKSLNGVSYWTQNFGTRQ